MISSLNCGMRQPPSSRITYVYIRAIVHNRPTTILATTVNPYSVTRWRIVLPYQLLRLPSGHFASSDSVSTRGVRCVQAQPVEGVTAKLPCDVVMLGGATLGRSRSG